MRAILNRSYAGAERDSSGAAGWGSFASSAAVWSHPYSCVRAPVAAALIWLTVALGCASETSTLETQRVAGAYFAHAQRGQFEAWSQLVTPELATKLGLAARGASSGPAGAGSATAEDGPSFRVRTGPGAPWRIASWTEVENDGETAVVEGLEAPPEGREPRTVRLTLKKTPEGWRVAGGDTPSR